MSADPLACVGAVLPFRATLVRAERFRMQAYHDLLRAVLERGKDRADRTGTGTLGIFRYQMRFDLREGWPLVTTKKLHVKSIVHELLWFLRGETHVKYLQDACLRIWNEWATAEQTARFGRVEGDLGPVYGHQWRNFGATRNPDGTYASDGVDQIKRLLHNLKEKPSSRRLIVTAGIRRRRIRSHFPLFTRSFSSTSRTESSRVSSTNGVPTSSSVGHTIIMGRKTWDEVGRPLPGRRNLVVSRQRDLELARAEVFSALDDAIVAARRTDDEPDVIGGSSVLAKSRASASAVSVEAAE